MSYSERRAQQRRARELRRRLEELDRLDREHGLGALPPHLQQTPGTHLAGHRPTSHRARRSHGPVLPGLLVALLVAGFVMLRDPGASGDRLRDLMGLDDQRLAEVVEAPSGGGEYRFAATQPGTDRPIAWNPCEPVAYVVNPAGAPAHWQELVTQSVANVSRATGLQFAYKGTTDSRAFEDRSPRPAPAPVLIGWATEEEVPELAGDVAGLGGSTAIETRPGRLSYVRGMVALDQEAFDELEDQAGGFDRQRAILDHELGHVVGLAHVPNPQELMYDQRLTRTTFGSGDLTGLAALGAVEC